MRCLPSQQPGIESLAEAAFVRGFIDHASAQPTVIPLDPMGAARVHERTGVDDQAAAFSPATMAMKMPKMG